MDFSNHFSTFLAKLAKLPQQKIAQLISVLLLAYIAFLAAKMTWLLAPGAAINNAQVVNQTANPSIDSKTSNYNIKALQALNLFGVYNEAPTEQSVIEVTDAPETRLNLTLAGLVASDDEKTAAAIITSQGVQETYGIGDVIKGTRANLERVLMDRVLIKQSGKIETLMLDGFDYNQPAKALAQQSNNVSIFEPQNTNMTPKSTNIVDQRTNKKLSQSAVNLKKDISEDPGNITDYLNIQPYKQSNELVGYKLSPGKSTEFFKLSGLQVGDIAVQMNGFDLTDAADSVQALAELKEASEVSLLVKRKEELIEILFSIQ